MFHRVRKHLTPSTFIALLALVFAVTGGAFAATGGGNGSHATLMTANSAKAKAKRGPRGPRGLAGPAGKNGAPGATGATGATGPAGPAGPAGGNGEKGEKGETGEKGKPGKNGEEGAPGEEGKPGVPGVIHGQEPLPQGATETGVWSVEVPATEEYVNEGIPATAPVSFTIPLEKALKRTHHVYINEGQAGEEHAAECPSTEEELGENEQKAPKAAEGYLCVYTEFDHGLTFEGFGGGGASGAFVHFAFEPIPTPPAQPVSGLAHGTWAVTAE